MSLDQIHLNPRQTADLYEGLLVDGAGPSTPTDYPLAAPPPMLGHYGRKILILVQEPDHAFLGDEDLQFLTGVITACKMSLADVGIVNLSSAPIGSFEQMCQSIEPSACWIFGIHTPAMGLPPMNDPNHSYTHRSLPIFWAPSLQQLATDPQAKRALWTQLKKHYGI